MSGSRSTEPQTPLLATDNEPVDGYTDYKGCPIKRSKSGGWRSASCILAARSLERFAYLGIESNLINYLTGPIGESVATAAANVNTWVGVASLVPIFGAFVADSFLGCYKSIIIAAILYILGLGLLTLSAMITPIVTGASDSQGRTKNELGPESPAMHIKALFFGSLYLIALAQGYNTFLQAFGANQFDEKHPEESKAKSSFFNWWFCVGAMGAIATHLILPYIQDNINWGIGFGIPFLAVIVGLILFLLGNKMYRFPATIGDKEVEIRYGKKDKGFKKSISALYIVAPSSSREESLLHGEFLKDGSPPAGDDSTNINETSSKTKEIKEVLRLFPIWVTCLTYTIGHAQSCTLFTKQATTLDRSIGQSYSIPTAALRIIIALSVAFCSIIYDRIFIPIARRITRYPYGITMLQRIGIGMAISVLNMVIAAVIEKKRLKTARDFGLLDISNATVPMTFWWLAPQYLLFGLVDVLINVGMQEFFYDQVPTELRCLGLSFSQGAIGIGDFLSSFLVSMIDKITSQGSRESWFSDNLNRAHVDYFYWLLAGIGVVGLIAFVCLAKSYIYREPNNIKNDSDV
nr:protein NRT1/ PTR FAMILY 5.10-like isoform X1 [Coffea arabica]